MGDLINGRALIEGTPTKMTHESCKHPCLILIEPQASVGSAELADQRNPPGSKVPSMGLKVRLLPSRAFQPKFRIPVFLWSLGPVELMCVAATLHKLGCC